MFTHSDIANHYERCEEHYRYFWNLNQSRSMHYGYWDSSTKTFHEALMNINKVMSEKAQINEHDKVLDAGCGIGGSSLWLAKNIGCSVIGITLSQVQKNQAEEHARLQGLSLKASFLQDDYTNTRFNPASFDVVWAIESVCHAEDKKMFFAEASRLLKPGGRLIVADFFSKKGLEGKQKEWMHKMAQGWAIDSFANMEDFENAAMETGFQHIMIENASQAILPSAKRLYFFSFIGILSTKLYGLLSKKQTELTKYNARTAFIQYRALKQGLWKYQIFQAIKPS